LTNIDSRSIFHLMVPEKGPNLIFGQAESAFKKAQAEYRATVRTLLGDPATTLNDLPMYIDDHRVGEVSMAYLKLHEPFTTRPLGELEVALAKAEESANLLNRKTPEGNYVMYPPFIGYHLGRFEGMRDAVSVVRENTDPASGLIRLLTWAQAEQMRVYALSDEELGERSRYFEPGREDAILFVMGKGDYPELSEKRRLGLISVPYWQ
jgi:hypothetical protein